MKFKIGFVGLLVVAALATMTTGTALAQEETPAPAPQMPGWQGCGFGRGFGRGFGGEVGLEAAAQVLGMTADELSTQLWGGKSLADLAEEAGVDLQDVQDAMAAAHEAATRESIEQAVEDGTLTRGHADWLLEGLDNGYLGGFPGHGRFGGFGRFPGGNNSLPAPSSF